MLLFTADWVANCRTDRCLRRIDGEFVLLKDIIRSLRHALLRLIGVGSLAEDDHEQSGAQVVDQMRRDLERLRTSAAHVLAKSYRIERELNENELKIHAIESDMKDAEERGDITVDTLRLQLESCRNRANNLEKQLESARGNVAEAKRQMEVFRSEVETASGRVRDAQLCSQLAAIRAQMQNELLDGAVYRDLSAIERMERRANAAQAEAEAIAELNEALRNSKNDENEQEDTSQ